MSKVRGWVYVITNQAMPGLVKVGYSTKDPSLRAAELSHTGAPTPYQVVYDVLVVGPREIEQRVHAALRGARRGEGVVSVQLGSGRCGDPRSGRRGGHPGVQSLLCKRRHAVEREHANQEGLRSAAGPGKTLS